MNGAERGAGAMRGLGKLIAHVPDDIRGGWGVSFEDLAIAALVMLPFTFALTLFVNSMAWWPSAVMIVLAGIVQGVGTYWNAGWRARTAQWGEAE
jgi:hypothetical protein